MIRISFSPKPKEGKKDHPLDALQDGKQAQDEKDQGAPLDKLVVRVRVGPGLMDKDGEEVKGDDGGACGVALAGREGVGRGGGFQEDCGDRGCEGGKLVLAVVFSEIIRILTESEEDEDLGPGA